MQSFTSHHRNETYSFPTATTLPGSPFPASPTRRAPSGSFYLPPVLPESPVGRRGPVAATHVSELGQATLAHLAEALVGRAALQEELRQAHRLAAEQRAHGGRRGAEGFSEAGAEAARRGVLRRQPAVRRPLRSAPARRRQRGQLLPGGGAAAAANRRRARRKAPPTPAPSGERPPAAGEPRNAGWEPREGRGRGRYVTNGIVRSDPQENPKLNITADQRKKIGSKCSLYPA